MIGKEETSSHLRVGGLFPSPCGEMIGKDLGAQEAPSNEVVSIPLRGNDRKSVDLFSSYNRSVVSIPLRGNDRKSLEGSFQVIEWVSIPLRGNDRKRIEPEGYFCFLGFHPLAGK